MTAIGWDRLDSLPDRQTVVLCVVSLGLPGSGPLEKVRAALPAAALVILSDDDDYASVAQAASQGARGYFSTATDLPVLVQGLRLVLLGGTAMPIAVNKAQAPARRVATSVLRFSAELFTPKELEVLRSLATGRVPGQAASRQSPQKVGNVAGTFPRVGYFPTRRAGFTAA